jgi:phage gp45-like
MEPTTLKFIRDEIKRQINIVLGGTSGANDSTQTETIRALYAGMPDIPDRPVMHPSGFASRAPAGTIQVTTRVGPSPENRLVMGHRDVLRANLGLQPGESMIYGSNGTDVLATVLVNDGVKITTQNGYFSILPNTDIDFDTGTVQGRIGDGGKVQFVNATGEFTAAIIQLFQDVAAGLTDTLIGPQPLVMETFVDDIAVLESFKR